MAEKNKTNNGSYMFYGYGVNEGEAYLKRAQVMDTEEVEGVVDEKIDELKGNAPEDLDTIEELAAAVQSGGGADISGLTSRVEELETNIENKPDTDVVENMIDTAVDEKTGNLFSSVEYDSNEKKILFKNESGEQVGEVNAADFIKDGMVSDVKVENGKLIISFNEDGGSDTVELDITEIFNASNYYTATECDEKYQPKDNYLTEESLTGYATEDFVTTEIGKLNIPTVEEVIEVADEKYQEKGDYLTEDNLSGYATEDFVTTKIGELEIPTVEEVIEAADEKYQPIGDYLTEDNLSGYATEDFVTTKIGELEIPTVEEVIEVADEKYQEKGDYLTEDNLSGYATEDFVTTEIGKLSIPTVEEVIEVADEKYQEKGDYATKQELDEKMDNVTLSSVATSGSYNDLLDKPTVISMNDVVEEVNEMGFLKEHQSLEGLFKSVEYVSNEKKINFKDNTNTVVGFVDTTDFVKDGMVDTVTVDENNNLVITFNTDSGKESVSVSLGAIFDPNNYFTTTQSDARYYQQDAANAIFVAKTTLESYSTTEQMDDAIEAAVEPKANKNDIDATINALVVRLNKLEATNNYLIEHNTDSADTINNMSPEDAANAEITVSTDEAIAALATPKTFKSVNVVGGELGSNTTITLNATDDVNVSGLTVSGTKGTGNGKINYATNEVSIDSVNIEPGCSVYNVFEGSQDRTPEHSIDKFTAKNVVVNDVDLAHNVFNIYQFNDDAEVVISDSSFNLNVANSNVLRVSNVTNAKNVTITFKNIDLTYENKPYTDGDIEWAGLVIYQPYGNDAAYTGDTSNTQTWSFNFINCRYNGELVTQNEVGTIRQLIYQYQVNKQGCEAPTAFGGNINISVE